jgi:hypothetical protein
MVKNITIGLVVCVAVIFGVMAFKAPTVITNTEYKTIEVPTLGAQSAPVVNVAAPKVTVNVPEQKQIFGAVASSDLMTNWFSFGGVQQWAGKIETLPTASSTVCAIQSPNATSTLVGGTIRFTLASTSAVTVDLAKGTTQYATTTKIGSTYGIAASAQATIVASSTGSVAGDGTIFAPNNWFVVRINEYSNSSGAGNAPTGKCQAIWRSI